MQSQMFLYCIHFRFEYICQWLINSCIHFNHIYVLLNICSSVFCRKHRTKKIYRVPSKQSVLSLSHMSNVRLFITEVTLNNVKIYITIWILKSDCIYEIKLSLNEIKQIIYFSAWQKYTVINSHISLLQGRCSCHVL